MKYSWKIKSFINHRDSIKHNILVSVGEEFIKFSQWKCDLITHAMRGIYKLGKNGEKITSY